MGMQLEAPIGGERPQVPLTLTLGGLHILEASIFPSFWSNKHWPSLAGTGTRAAEASGFLVSTPFKRGSAATIAERQKLLFPCWVNICGSPRLWLTVARVLSIAQAGYSP